MKRRGLVSKGTISRMEAAARAAWEARDWDKCMEELESVRRIDPANVDLHIRMGRIAGLQHDYAAAKRYFEMAVNIIPAPNKAGTLAEIGQQARDFYSRDLAKAYLERAVQVQPTPQVLVRLAEVCERLRDTARSTELINQALAMESGFAPARLARGRLASRGGRLEEAERELRPLLEISVDPEVRARAGYELGTVLDKQGRYEEAMTAFLNAKALLHYSGAPRLAHLQAARKFNCDFLQQLSPEILQRWRTFGNELQPRYNMALLAGHPRSGTTLLEQVIDSHPGIVSIEETTVFSDYVYLPQKSRFAPDAPLLPILETAEPSRIVSSRAAYIRAAELCLGEGLNNRLLIDKNPSYTFQIPAFARFFPETKFLVCLRDPRDVCLSCFMQAFVPVEEVSSSWLRLENTVREYAALMSTWLTLKPMLPNPWLEVRYEDMVEDLESVARKCLEFLEVPWDERVLGFAEHAQKKIVRSPTYSDVTQKVFKRARGRWRNYQKYLEPHLPVLEPFVKAFGYE